MSLQASGEFLLDNLCAFHRNTGEVNMVLVISFYGCLVTYAIIYIRTLILVAVNKRTAET